MSMPTSFMAVTATGLICPAGAEPAERTSTASPASARRKPAAIWERPALCTQTNRTLGLRAFMRTHLLSVGGEKALAQGEADVDQGDEDGYLDEWADDAGEGLAG